MKRFAMFERLIESLPRPLKILDVGGTVSFWEHRDWARRDDCQITLLNLQAEPSPYAHIQSTAGSAFEMPEHPDDSFHIVFSNSVIEHLYTFQNQRRMAAEVRRVGMGYWIQTPNFYFPIEPHFHVPGWHWMPIPVRIALLQHFRCGWRGPCPDKTEATELVKEVRLMSRRELRACFPDAVLYAEHFKGLTKSFVAIGGVLRDAYAAASLD
ncbi:MAG: class I SAM-dependent methyltransferase [Phycisphaerales bacterium JB054]